ncbi:uncharacterized protein LOC141550964 isoform X2 [Sminthopsis crassicaudata]|uniref:uncharacterized protein LOC141550964 isoform X2 n=1 Tax=Sminthopsis crassicaudata TaxID=9301 RepID=UPI003D682DDD
MGSFPPDGDLYRYSLDLRANWSCKGRKHMRLQRSIIMNRLTPQAKSRRWLVTYLLEKNDRNDYLELFLELDQHEVPSANLRFTNGIFCKVKKIQIKGQKRMENKINIELQKRSPGFFVVHEYAHILHTNESSKSSSKWQDKNEDDRQWPRMKWMTPASSMSDQVLHSAYFCHCHGLLNQIAFILLFYQGASPYAWGRLPMSGLRTIILFSPSSKTALLRGDH